MRRLRRYSKFVCFITFWILLIYLYSVLPNSEKADPEWTNHLQNDYNKGIFNKESTHNRATYTPHMISNNSMVFRTRKTYVTALTNTTPTPSTTTVISSLVITNSSGTATVIADDRAGLKDTISVVNNMSLKKNGTTGKDVYVQRNSSDSVMNDTGSYARFILNENNNTSLTKVSLKRDLSFYRINTTVSDIIGPNRTIPDTRPDKCKDIQYPDVLPKVSVVIIFREEWPSVLIRTVYSILNHSPRNLLREIVLVDDGSLDTEPKLQVKKHFADVNIVKLIVNSKPLGLMMARQTGIDATTSDHFIVMDSHIEVGQGWLVPIIARLVEAPNSLLTPDVGSIHYDTFEIKRRISEVVFPIYDPLTLSELWAPYTKTYKRLRNGSVDPIPIASVQGMFIAMKKDFFMRLGGFDPGMKQWGSEQFELSIKVWMCGGRVEMIPCSRVVHLYRLTPWVKVDFIVGNSLRTTEVWFDDPYKSIIRETIGKHIQYDMGNLTDRHRIRKENNCKPFQYFVDMVKTFSDVYLIDKIKAKGCVRNVYLDKCLTLDITLKLSIETCKNEPNQNFILTETDQIRSLKGTIVRSIIDQKQNTNVRIEVAQSIAYSYMRNALWEYRHDKSLYNVASRHCLTVNRDKTLVAERCTGEPIQQWDWNRL